MMRPMKLAGDQLVFGRGCLEHLKSLKGSRAMIVMNGLILEKYHILSKVTGYLDEAGISHEVFHEVEPEPGFATVRKGAEAMKVYMPDIIIALGGGSAMDAAKAMWIFYEHPELTEFEDILPPNTFPKLHKKAIMVCIPSTSGTASEVSRSIVITDEKTKIKHGVGNMEMMPDIAICDPEVTASMPPKVTAETGLDALTHAVEAYLSNRANYVTDILASKAVEDIFMFLPKAFEQGNNLYFRERMLNASLIAGMAFTNVSLGIVHSMAHTIGSCFGISHGLADAIILPYVIDFNSTDPAAAERYSELAAGLNANSFSDAVKDLNAVLGIPASFKTLITDEESYKDKLMQMAEMALADGCTKTNPVIPAVTEFVALFTKVYKGAKQRRQPI